MCRPRPAGASGFEERGLARAARPGRCGWPVGPAVSEGSAGFFRAQGGPDSPQEPSARRGKDCKAVLPLRGKNPRDPAGPQRGRSSDPRAAWSAPPADCAGGAGSRGHACAARDRAPRGPGRLPRGRGAEGEGGVVDSRESARRSAPPLRDLKNEEGRGEASRGGGTHSRWPSRHFAGEDGTVWKRRVGGFPQPRSLGGGATSLR